MIENDEVTRRLDLNRDGIISIGDRFAALEKRIGRIEDKLGYRNAIGIGSGWAIAATLAFYLLSHLTIK